MATKSDISDSKCEIENYLRQILMDNTFVEMRSDTMTLPGRNAMVIIKSSSAATGYDARTQRLLFGCNNEIVVTYHAKRQDNGVTASEEHKVITLTNKQDVNNFIEGILSNKRIRAAVHMRRRKRKIQKLCER